MLGMSHLYVLRYGILLDHRTQKLWSGVTKDTSVCVRKPGRMGVAWWPRSYVSVTAMLTISFRHMQKAVQASSVPRVSSQAVWPHGQLWYYCIIQYKIKKRVSWNFPQFQKPTYICLVFSGIAFWLVSVVNPAVSGHSLVQFESVPPGQNWCYWVTYVGQLVIQI